MQTDSNSAQPKGLTKLEVGIVGADVVAGTEKPLHHQGCAHCIKQTKVFGDSTFLGVRGSI